MNNEAEIAARLQSTIPRPTQPSTTPAPSAATEPQGFVSDIGDNTNLYRLYDYFNVEPVFRTGDSEDKLQVIYRWAADKAQSTDYLAVVNVLTAYNQGLGAGSLDKSGLNRMYEFVQLDREISRLREAQGAL